MRTLVTGGAGFIGSALVDRLLAEGHEVDVVDDLSTGTLANLAAARQLDAPLTFQRMDIRVPELIEYVQRRRPQVIFHLAAQTSVVESVRRPIFDADVNVIGSLRVFEAALGAKCPKVIVAASGGSLYGESPEGAPPLTEEASQAPSSPYAISRRAMIDYLRSYQRLFGLEFSVLALANVYGPRQRFSSEGGVVSIFAKQLSDGAAPTIYGDGLQSRDFVFVDDVVDAFIRAIDRGDGDLCNISSATEVSVRALYDEVARTLGCAIDPIIAPARAGELRRSVLANDHAARVLGWRPFTSLSEGVAATVASLGPR